MSVAAVLKRSKADRESWRYTNLEALLKELPAPQVAPGDAPLVAALPGIAQRLTFIDGEFYPDQSHFGALPPDALQGDAAQGYRMMLAGQTCLVTAPVELLFLATGRKAETATPLHIELGANGRLTLIERHENAGATSAVVTTTIALQPQAKLVHGKIISGGDAAHLAQTSVQVADGAFYDNFTLIKGGRLTRNEIEASLNGKMAQCAMNGAMLLRGREHADTTTRITHAAPHGTSREVYKTVLAEQARGVFQGKIIVKEGAQKTDGHQLSRALLLSDQAEMDAKPELEIYADDVKCSHGSTVGDLDADAMFYLRARGLTETQARALLIDGFTGEVVAEIPVPAWRDMFRAEMEGWQQ